MKRALQQSDPKELEKIINKVLENADKVTQYKSGRKLYGFFVGEVMKLSLKGKPKIS